jgi:hypothetical protein
MPWSALPWRARAFRVFHVLVAVVMLSALGNVWRAALVRRRDTALAVSVGALLVQGAGIVVGRGNCPLGPLQARAGDPAPCFELVLPPRAAKAAFPVLFAFTLAGLAAVVVRPPRRAGT